MDGRCIYHFRAMSLIEVLIALCIVSIGLLAQAKMQLVALSHTQFARQYSRALLAAPAIAENHAAISNDLKKQLPQAKISRSDGLITISWFDRNAQAQRAQLKLEVAR